jgi:hypothetical protein
MGSKESITEPIGDALRRYNPAKYLLTAGYIAKEAGPPVVNMYPNIVWLGTDDGYLKFSIDDSTGYLDVAETSSTSLPDSLLEEPSIQPVLIDLSTYYLSEVEDVEFTTASIYFLSASGTGLPLLRAIAMHRIDGRTLLIDPLWPFGIKIGNETDLARLRQEINNDVHLAEILL